MEYKPLIYCDWASNIDLGMFDKKITLSIDNIPEKLDGEINVLLQIEPDSISGQIANFIKNHDKFDLILCWDERLLNCKNSELFPFGTSWVPAIEDVKNKKLKVSYITSSKSNTKNHVFRHEVFNYLKGVKDVEIMSHMSPPRIESKLPFYQDSMYSIVIENDSVKNWFTEKLIDCLITSTIPIYKGCPNIGDFFDRSGIITFDTISELEYILNNINESFFKMKIETINKNRMEATKYSDIWKRISNRFKEL
jgi:hypothetical protein